HTVNDEIIKFGLSVTGIARPEEITAIQGARPGDDLVLTKAVGTGLVTTALKRGVADPADVEATVRSMKTLNAAASRAMTRTGVRAATDITGFGLLGHLFEMLEASGVSAELTAATWPLLPGALRYAGEGVNTGGGRNNAAFVGDRIQFAPDVPAAVPVVGFDPQTSGGLLMAVPPDRTGPLLDQLAAEQVPVRAVIGRVGDGPAGTIRVRQG
ncbi:MAG: selenide, water dikinase SelD, partial [Armatimonadetes bacterium]|nr:selenide, water dikinase SelD [Armatimonadota bacterium]